MTTSWSVLRKDATMVCNVLFRLMLVFSKAMQDLKFNDNKIVNGWEIFKKGLWVFKL